MNLMLSFFSNLLGLGIWCVRQTVNGNWTYGKIGKLSNVKKIKIIANGPSLVDDLKDDIKNAEYDYCMINDSMITPMFKQLRPSRFVLADTLYFNRDLEGENNPRIMAFTQVDWPMQLFVPKSAIPYVENKLSECKNIIIKPLPTFLPKYVKSNRIRNFFYKHYMACPPVQNVVVGAIYSCIMSGYKEIELYGVGHSWTTQLAVNEQNQVCLSDVHYYDLNAPMKPWMTVEGNPYRMHTVLRDLAQMFESYWELRFFADSLNNVKIYNMTKASFIDAFDRR